jgi:serine phosphatase RsbU (regulator of sigma subunit)
MDPATTRPSRFWRPDISLPRGKGAGAPGGPQPAIPVGDLRALALARLALLAPGAIAVAALLALAGLASFALPILLAAAALLVVTAAGYALGRRAGDLRGAWLLFTAADTIIILTLSAALGSFMDVLLIVVVVELARVYRRPGPALASGGVAAALLVAKYAILETLRPGTPLEAALPADAQRLLLLAATALAALICAVSLASFIQHYAREIFSYERIREVNAAEMHVAHEIQTSLMAPSELVSGQWSIAAISVPAQDVGGDFYEYVAALGNTIGGIAIGDVSGKGIPAALQMAVVRTIFRIEARRRIFPAETLTRVNQSLQTEMQTQGMVTLLYAFVDPLEGVMHYSNAGHNYPILINDTVEELKLAGLPLGVDGDVEYDERSVPVPPGTSVVFYTDGVVEAFNERGELFGFDRLLTTLYDARALAPRALVDHVVSTVQAFAGAVPQSDDITIVAVCNNVAAPTRSPAALVRPEDALLTGARWSA